MPALQYHRSCSTNLVTWKNGKKRSRVNFLSRAGSCPSSILAEHDGNPVHLCSQNARSCQNTVSINNKKWARTVFGIHVIVLSRSSQVAIISVLRPSRMRMTSIAGYCSHTFRAEPRAQNCTQPLCANEKRENTVVTTFWQERNRDLPANPLLSVWSSLDKHEELYSISATLASVSLYRCSHVFNMFHWGSDF